MCKSYQHSLWYEQFPIKTIWTKFGFYFLTLLSAIANLSCHPIFLGSKNKNSKFSDFLALHSLNQLVNNFGLKIINFQRLAFNGLNHGLVLKTLHRIIKLQQKLWLKSYIDMKTGLRKKAKNDFERDFLKLMNNALFGKTLEI